MNKKKLHQRLFGEGLCEVKYLYLKPQGQKNLEKGYLPIWKEKFNFIQQNEKKGSKLKNLGFFKSGTFFGPTKIGFEV